VVFETMSPDFRSLNKINKITAGQDKIRKYMHKQKTSNYTITLETRRKKEKGKKGI